MNTKDIFEIRDINQIISNYKLGFEKIPIMNKFGKVLNEIKNNVKHTMNDNNNTLIVNKKTFVEYYIYNKKLVYFNYSKGILKTIE